MAELDHCAACGSPMLICRLGEVECRSCGYVRDVEREPGDRGDRAAPTAPGLSEDVAQALARLLKGQRA
ncbi:MAG TPA: hypothetical protein VF069_07735 [Streptosporangiaceae bacterium]